jgi:hypothetical protein
VGTALSTGWASWVRCICSARGSPGRGDPPALERQSGARRRRRESGRLGPVCLWCARGGRDPHSRRSRLTPTSSGADRRCQGQPVRAERSEPRSGGLDCRRAAELCRSASRACGCMGTLVYLDSGAGALPACVAGREVRASARAIQRARNCRGSSRWHPAEHPGPDRGKPDGIHAPADRGGSQPRHRESLRVRPAHSGRF